MDLIDRQTAINAIAKMMPKSYTPDGSHPADEEIFRVQEIFADCIQTIENLPSVQPEIIRCKDCKHRPKGTGANHDLEFPDGVCPCQNPDDYWYSWKPDDDWFCADGERKEE